MPWRLAVLAGVLGVALSPLAVLWWLFRSLADAIERMNGSS